MTSAADDVIEGEGAAAVILPQSTGRQRKEGEKQSVSSSSKSGEGEEGEEEEEATGIQASWHMITARVLACEQESAAVKVQAVVRGFVARHAIRVIRDDLSCRCAAAVRIQTTLRGAAARTMLSRRALAAITMKR